MNEYYLHMGEHNTEGLWGMMSVEEVSEFKRTICVHCRELGTHEGPVYFRACNFQYNHGYARRCSPLSCIEVGMFQPKHPWQLKDPKYMEKYRKYVNDLIGRLNARGKQR